MALRKHLTRRRVVVYAGLLALEAALTAATFAQRATLRPNAVRDRAILARPVEGDAIENIFRLQVMSAQEIERTLTMALQGADGQTSASPAQDHVAPAAALTLPLTVRLGQHAAQAMAGPVIPIQISIADANPSSRERAESVSTFIVPH